MSEKPVRRRSQLAGLSPATPLSGRAEGKESATENAALKSALAGQSPAAPKRRAKADSSTQGNRAKMGYYAVPEDSERIRAAFIAARSAGRPWRSLSEFQLEAILEKVTQLEAELNGGQSFKGAPAHTLSPGRPLE